MPSEDGQKRSTSTTRPRPTPHGRLSVESLNPYKGDLIPLTTLASRVEAFASLCCPDFEYTDEDDRGLAFQPIDLEELLGIEDAPSTVGMAMRDETGGDKIHLFTRWSRSQLLSHLGTREKWFKHVDLSIQAHELNERRRTFRKHMFRTMRSHDSEEIRIVRGLVSAGYGDIPDTRIMKILLKLLPDGWALRSKSGKTDRALYVYAITRDEVHIPQTSFKAFPGVIIKNSEVAYSSLWVFPMLYMPHLRSAAVFERDVVLRKIHRGKAEDLEKEFTEAMDAVSGSWGDLETRLGKLATIFYANQDEALAKMERLLLGSGSTKAFAQGCRRTYEASGHATHTGLTICEAILARVEQESDKNSAYSHASLAGAVLLKLMG